MLLSASSSSGLSQPQTREKHEPPVAKKVSVNLTTYCSSSVLRLNVKLSTVRKRKESHLEAQIVVKFLTAFGSPTSLAACA